MPVKPAVCSEGLNGGPELLCAGEHGGRYAKALSESLIACSEHLVCFNSTSTEIHNKPRHTRRSLSLRPIPESDPHFAEIFGAREDVESVFSNLKYLTRGKLKSTDEDRNLFTITAYMLLWMTRARTAHHKSLAANPTQAIPIAA